MWTMMKWKIWAMAALLTCAAAVNEVIYRAGEDERCNRTVDIYQAISSPPVTEKNRNKPLHCTYRIRVRPARNDWVVIVRFTRMRVGEPSADRQRCLGGYIQILDGYRDTNHTNKDNPGFYCGEIDSPKTFMSETPHVKIVLHLDRYNQDSFLQFDASVEQQQEVHARYGQYAQLYPHRRGTPVPGTYCERVFHNCSPTRCFVQSPGFPGIYPRNLHCRYHLVVSQSVVALDLNAFDVDGLRCDNLLMCFPRPLTQDPEDCPFDFVRVYDGSTDESPVIVTLCGRGRLKSHIVASGPEMLVDFVTSPAGPLLNTGFHFKAESIYGETEYESLQLHNGSCAIERQLRDGQASTFTNLRSWYPANTTCTYRFAASEDEILRLTFDFFRMERVTLCEESLKLYDAGFADPSKIMSKLCDINKPRTDQPRSIYETTGSVMFIEFLSRIGSLEGSSLSYAFEVRPVNTATHRNSLSQNTCSRTYTPDGGLMGSIFTTFSEVNVSSSSPQPLTCNYSFDASVLPQGRVNITVYTSLKMADDCEECSRESLYAEVALGPGPHTCFCKISNHRGYALSSFGPQMFLALHVETPSEKRLQQKNLINVSYNFFSESRCGPEKLELDLQGVVVFPPHQGVPCIGDRCQDGPIFCTWKIPVFHRMDVAFRITGLQRPGNCSVEHVVVGGVLLCPSSGDQEVLLYKDDIHSDVTVNMRMAGLEFDSANITIGWTQLRILPSHSNPDTLMSLGKDCDFLCTSSMACLTRELVCNSVPNCPGIEGTSADEDINLCVAQQDSFKLYWWIIGFGLGICACLTFFLVFTICRKCHVGRHRF